ncbi:MAG: 6-phosphogluconolactonase, partial [Deltaproteobacteria bacterium]
KDSNFGGAWNSLLSQISTPESNIHRIKGEIPPLDGALEYEDELKTFFVAGTVPAFDLIFLGMGEDGHTASLFPASDSLKEDKRLVVPVYVERLKSWRITLTLPVLNNAHSVVFLVTGRNKGAVLKEILENKSTWYPAGLIKPDKGSLIWLLDNDAAGKISVRPTNI